MTTQETPNIVDRLLSSDRLQALADSPHAPIQLFGLVTQDGLAVAAGVLDVVDERVGIRDDEHGLPLTLRLLSRATEATEDIRPPALKEVVEGAADLALAGYGLARGYIEDVHDQISEWDRKGF